jgi:hypothetical protein
MTLHEFNHLPAPRQRATVYLKGRLLTVRWEGDDVAVYLYYLPGGLFAELYVDLHLKTITQVRAFTDAAQLEDYAMCVKLPGWMPEAE